MDGYEYSYSSISFSDARNGTAIGWALSNADPFAGYKTVVLRTKDGGHSWNAQKSAVQSGYSSKSAKFKKIVAIDSLHLVAIGDSGLMMSTQDAGETWSQIDSIRPGNVMDVSFSDKRNGIACTEFGKLRFTSDGGKSWDFTNNIVYYDGLRTISAISSEVFYAFDYFYDRMLRTFDRGVHWDTIQVISDYYKGSSGKFVSTVFFQDSATGFVFGGDFDGGTRPLIMRTSNGGLSWDTVFNRSVFGNGIIQSVSFRDKLHGVAGAGRGVLTTSDGGLNWVEDSISITANDFSVGIAYPSPDRMFVCSSQGFVGSLVGYLPTAGVTQKLTSIGGVSVYPNPAPNQFTIVLSHGLTRADVKLTDVLGRVVKSLRLFERGEVTIDRDGLPAGSYFLQVGSGDTPLLRSKILLQ